MNYKSAYIISADWTVGNGRWLQVCISCRETRRTHWKVFTLEGLPLDGEGEFQTSHFIQINCKFLLFRYKKIFCFALFGILTFLDSRTFNKGSCKIFSIFFYLCSIYPFSRVLRIDWYQNFQKIWPKKWSKEFAKNSFGEN